MRVLFSATLIAGTLLAAAPVIAAPARVFTQDGVHYSYRTIRQADGSVSITGVSGTDSQPFALNVRDRHVSGTVGRKPVDFEISRKQQANLLEEATLTQTADAR